MDKLSIQMVKGSANILLNSSTAQVVESIGVTPEEWELLTNDVPWLGVDRPRITRIIDSLLYGLVDTMGVPRFDLPAEYVATVVAIFVSPCNYFSACSWLGAFSTASTIQSHNPDLPPEGMERVHPSKIFAFVCDIRSGSFLTTMCKEFERKIKLKLAITGEGDTHA